MLRTMTTDPSLQDDLAAALAPPDEFAATPDIDDDGPDRFVVDNDRKGTWALRKLGEARARLGEIDVLYEEELARLDAWRERAKAEPKRSATYFEGLLQNYLRILRADDPDGKKRSSWSLPGGTIQARRSASMTVTDPVALLAWAQANHPDLIVAEVPAGVAKKLLAKDGADLTVFTADGEKVPGVAVENRLNVSVVVE